MLEDLQVMFLPIPKSGCTSVLWQVAGLAGLERERFERTRTHEVSRSMAIHDMDLWEPRHQWRNHTSAEQQQILDGDNWLRLSVARDPAPRLFSAWQSKLLLQEPRFVARFAEEDWFPTRVDSVDQVIAAFRDFVHALDVHPDEAPHDAHWGPQHDLMAGFDLNFVGRAEDPAATSARLQEHLGGRARLAASVPRENANPIPYHPSVYDEATADVLNRVYAGDFSAYGYAPLDVSRQPEADAWRGLAQARLHTVTELVERHLRIAELLDLLRETEAQRDRAESSRRQVAERLDATLNSRSWRVTAPLRGLRRP